DLAGQSVPHLHIHVLPRREGDDLPINWRRAANDLHRAEIARPSASGRQPSGFGHVFKAVSAADVEPPEISRRHRRRRNYNPAKSITGTGSLPMAIGMLDSLVFADMFGTPEMQRVFGDAGFFARCIEVEAALARAQARHGIIPAEAAAAIARAAD